MKALQSFISGGRGVISVIFRVSHFSTLVAGINCLFLMRWHLCCLDVSEDALTTASCCYNALLSKYKSIYPKQTRIFCKERLMFSGPLTDQQLRKSRKRLIEFSAQHLSRLLIGKKRTNSRREYSNTLIL